MRTRRLLWLVTPAVAAFLACSLLTHRSVLARPSLTPTRSFEFVYQAHFPAQPDATGAAHLWLPVPQPDGYQQVRDLQIGSAVAHKEGRESKYGNRFVEFSPTPAQVASGFDATLRFSATRREHKVALGAAVRPAAFRAEDETELRRYLLPDRLVPLNGVIAQLAREHTAGDTTDLQKARHIYEYVVATMRYDKTGEGWGRGDALWACDSKRGNCTDFHSVFIGMMRASGIPARFEIGFPLPEGKSEGDIPGYHCWAEFYLAGTGWVPVDASEAWKNPAKHDYFFGAHDVNRVFFSYGRDLRLGADQKGDPLNYFIYPYAEVNGQPVKGVTTHFSFRDLASASTDAGR
ncbi:MAG TPA: transglutaminase domain-containing protein [Candidatus Acidoferrales bacterium]|nr:transglutaminase domain-containing protein [Candidatus Acidoferrales bacterium]